MGDIKIWFENKMNIAVIFAGGVGSRMKMPGEKPKQFLEINGIPILAWTMRNFQDEKLVNAIVVVMLEKYIDLTWEIVKKYGFTKVKGVVSGGSTGQESIYNGLKEAEKISIGDDDIVLIHDGVRPYIEADLIKRNVESVRKNGTAVSCAPSKETTVMVSNNGEMKTVFDRSKIWLARAPQSFYLKDILKLHEKYHATEKNDIIDSCTMMMMNGKKIHVVETCAENLKITTPEDYYAMCGLIKKKI